MPIRRRGFHWNPSAMQRLTIFKSLGLALISSILLSIVALIVKKMKNLHPGQLAMYRLFATFSLTLPDIVKSGQNPLWPPEYRFLIFLRGITGASYVFFSFIALRNLGLGEANVILYSTPGIVALFARIFFKEPCGIFQSITIFLTILGIIFVSKLPSRLTEIPVTYTSEKLYGLFAAIVAMFFLGAMQLITRKTRSVNLSVLNCNFSCVGMAFIVFLTSLFGNFRWHQCGIQNVYILLLGFLSHFSLTLMGIAFRCDYAGPVSTMKAASEIAMAFLWQIVIFHDVPDIYGIVGAILILVTIILVGLGKGFANLDETCFLLKKKILVSLLK